MKTIFRYTNIGFLMAALFAVGTVANFAQDVCADIDGQNAANDKIQALYKDKTIAGKKATVDAGKRFAEKYGACESAKDLAEWLKVQLPKIEGQIKALEEAAAKDALVKRFNKGLETKNWDEVYASGKELLVKYPEEYRDVELVLGTIGYDESYKGNFKYNDDTIRYAKASLADLESGKTFSANFGVPKEFVYKTKENARGWMNYAIGYITQVAQKNKKDALPYLYQATQLDSETKKNPIPFELVGYYYFDELDKLTTEIKAMAADQKETDTPEIAKQKVDAIKAKVALSNGTAERAMDAFSRAFTLSQVAAYKAKMKTNVENAYKLRFAKGAEGLDAWIATAVAKPFVNPTTPVTPISDPEPVVTTTSTAPPATTKPVIPPTVKPGPASTIKPAVPATAKPSAAVKPQAKVKKPVAKKKVG